MTNNIEWILHNQHFKNSNKKKNEVYSGFIYSAPSSMVKTYRLGFCFDYWFLHQIAKKHFFFFLAAIIYWQKPMDCHIITLSNRGSKDFEPALETSNVIKYFLFDLLKQKNLSNLNRAQMGFFVWPYWYYWYETRNIEWGSKEKRIERKQDFYLFIFC